MPELLLTKNSTFIIGPISTLLGYLMEGIFWVLGKVDTLFFGSDAAGPVFQNIGLAIILFTIIIYCLMLPLTIKQQKFSKLSAKMNPELQAITAKYKGKKDNDSVQRMNEETKAVYAKYGVSPTGSCLQLIIQMPILFALYRVIYNMPAYVGQIKDEFLILVNPLMKEAGSSDFIQTFQGAAQFTKQFSNELFINGDVEYVSNTFIDVLNKANSAEWDSLIDKFGGLEGIITSTRNTLEGFNTFLGLNIGNSPWYTLTKEAWPEKNWLLIIGAIAIPLLSALTQWLNLKLSPQANNNDTKKDGDNPMMASMKTMNTIMPLMSAYFCFTLPAGMGLYWIAGAVVRGIQQVCINKYIDRIDIDSLIEKNTAKYNEKLKKQGMLTQGINGSAKKSTKSFSTYSNPATKPEKTQAEKDEEKKKATEYYNSKSKKDSKGGSIADKAKMVKMYNEKNNK